MARIGEATLNIRAGLVFSVQSYFNYPAALTTEKSIAASCSGQDRTIALVPVRPPCIYTGWIGDVVQHDQPASPCCGQPLKKSTSRRGEISGETPRQAESLRSGSVGRDDLVGVGCVRPNQKVKDGFCVGLFAKFASQECSQLTLPYAPVTGQDD
jgi:hypothetical protein